jgi:hypothetical protein
MVRVLIILLFLCSNAFGQLVISEVLSNEPSSRVRLEWIELFNKADYEIDLGDYIVIVDSDTNSFPENSNILPESYLILARQLLTDNGSDSFESYWGDASGVWGDHFTENYAAFDVDMTLSNSNGSIKLTTTDGTDIEYIAWDQSSDDGRSIEKDDVYADFSGWHDCYDLNGSTPGRLNSEIPAGGAEAFEISVSPKTIIPNSDDDKISIEVIIPAGSKLTIDIFDETGKKRRRLIQDSSLAVLELEWDGTDGNGDILSPGPYFIGFFLTGQKNNSQLVPVAVTP